ncbi:MAG: N-6 DNA methylase [Microgenomates group bacterium]
MAGTYRSFIGEHSYPPYKDVPGYCKVATIEEIEKNKFILTPGRYVGNEEIREDDKLFNEKIRYLTKQYSKLSEESKNLDTKILKNMKTIGFDIKNGTSLEI